MIKHVAMYQLRDKSKREFVLSALKKMDLCPLITKNEAYESCETNLPNLRHPLFADLIHIAYFADEESAQKYPTSKEHIDLVKNTNEYISQTMTIDFIE